MLNACYYQRSPVEKSFPDFIAISIYIYIYNQIVVHSLKFCFSICFEFNFGPGQFAKTCSLLSELLYQKMALWLSMWIFDHFIPSKINYKQKPCLSVLHKNTILKPTYLLWWYYIKSLLILSRLITKNKKIRQFL